MAAAPGATRLRHHRRVGWPGRRPQAPAGLVRRRGGRPGLPRRLHAGGQPGRARGRDDGAAGERPRGRRGPGGRPRLLGRGAHDGGRGGRPGRAGPRRRCARRRRPRGARLPGVLGDDRPHRCDQGQAGDRGGPRSGWAASGWRRGTGSWPTSTASRSCRATRSTTCWPPGATGRRRKRASSRPSSPGRRRWSCSGSTPRWCARATPGTTRFGWHNAAMSEETHGSGRDGGAHGGGADHPGRAGAHLRSAERPRGATSPSTARAC